MNIRSNPRHNKTKVLCLAALLLAGIAVYATVARYTVTATIFNTNCTSTINGGNCTLSSDGLTAGYAVYQNGPGVNSTLTPDSTGAGTLYDQWNLSFGNASSRSVYLTLTPINGAPPIFTGSQSFQATLYSRCFTDATASTDQNWTLITSTNYPNGDPTCAMRVLFTSAGVSYTLVMSPAEAAKSEPATGAATVTCTSNTSPCTSWTDVPTTGITNANVANLYNGGSSPIGQYYLSFNVSLTHP